MIYGMYLSTAGTKAASYRQDVIANNMANMDTAGFRRQFASARERLDHLSARGMEGPPTSWSDPRLLGGGPALYTTRNDFKTQGPLKSSSSPSHMAIAGQGFFRVRRDNQTLLSRNGAFTYGADGSLLTDDGSGEVLDKGGSAIRVDPTRPFTVTPDHVVVQDGRRIAELSVVNPKDFESLEPIGSSFYQYDGRDEPSDCEVVQFFVEGSNVEPVREMVDLIDTARAFELNIQMIQLQNDSLGQLIGQVPSPT